MNNDLINVRYRETRGSTNKGCTWLPSLRNKKTRVDKRKKRTKRGRKEEITNIFRFLLIFLFFFYVRGNSYREK